jgi:hypothetical protein
MQDLVKHVIKCLNKANTFDTKLTKDVFSLEGMSGIKTRIFYNELCSRPETVYLEVGSWKGSTICSAGYGNTGAKIYCIENWSLFGGPKDEFHTNTKKFGLEPVVFEEDFNSFDATKVSGINVYLYDGNHSYDEQKLAITKMWNSLANECIIVIDDWNIRHDVKQATLDGLHEVGAEIHEQFEFQYSVGPEHNLYDPNWCEGKNVHTPFAVAAHEFWNGIGVFVVRKSKSTVDV